MFVFISAALPIDSENWNHSFKTELEITQFSLLSILLIQQIDQKAHLSDLVTKMLTYVICLIYNNSNNDGSITHCTLEKENVLAS